MQDTPSLPGNRRGGGPIEPLRKGNDQDSTESIGEFWTKQEEETPEFDFSIYNSIPWMILKTSLAISMMTLVYILYGLHELPWRLFGSGTGLLILAGAPFFAGIILGYSFESPKLSLFYAIIIGFISIGLGFLIMSAPYLMKLAYYEMGFMSDVWFYGFFIPFLLTISFVPAGAMLAASTNVYE
ncbi:MAG: hypothetical protein Q7J68_03750 [Thermoplasmata archaeon]|nr:hypothetical protein [Thermoplasmata archaeon]